MTYEEIMGLVMPAVCSQLVCPASAQFPADMISITGNDAWGYQVSGFVDSQNSYGAMIRNDFSVYITIQNGFPVVRSAMVGARANAQRAKSFGANYLAIMLLTTIGGLIMYFLITALVNM